MWLNLTDTIMARESELLHYYFFTVRKKQVSRFYIQTHTIQRFSVAKLQMWFRLSKFNVSPAGDYCHVDMMYSIISISTTSSHSWMTLAGATYMKCRSQTLGKSHSLTRWKMDIHVLVWVWDWTRLDSN